MTPADIKAAREAAALTQAQAAQLVLLGDKHRWMEYESGKRVPDPARWMLFLLLTGQHPVYRLLKRRQ